MTFEDDVAYEAARAAVDHAVEFADERGREIVKVVFVVWTDEGGRAIVGLHAFDENDRAGAQRLLADWMEAATIIAAAAGKQLKVTEAP